MGSPLPVSEHWLGVQKVANGSVLGPESCGGQTCRWPETGLAGLRGSGSEEQAREAVDMLHKDAWTH